MRKIDIDKIFNCLCDIVMHELSAKDMLRQWEEKHPDKLKYIFRFIHEERRSRNLPDLDIRLMPAGLTYSWGEWNSGGGCMIWSMDFLDDLSVHLTDEVCILVNTTSEHYWSLEDWEDQKKYHLAECDMNDIAQGRDVDFLFTPFIGQECADAVKKDVDIISDII